MSKIVKVEYGLPVKLILTCDTGKVEVFNLIKRKDITRFKAMVKTWDLKPSDINPKTNQYDSSKLIGKEL